MQSQVGCLLVKETAEDELRTECSIQLQLKYVPSCMKKEKCKKMGYPTSILTFLRWKLKAASSSYILVLTCHLHGVTEQLGLALTLLRFIFRRCSVSIMAEHWLSWQRYSLWSRVLFTCPEDGGDTFLRCVGSNQSLTVLHPRRWHSLRYSVVFISNSRQIPG
jgi:hypothetical protein